MSRFSRRWGPFLGGVIGAITLVFAILLLLTQTNPGRERILEITLETLGGQLHPEAELLVERLEGGLFTGARMYGITLRDPEGEAVMDADSAYIQYRLASFFGGDVLIENLVLYSPDVLLYRFPSDSLWNYQALLQDTTAADEPEGAARATVINALRLIDAEIMVRVPWEPADDLTGEERAREIEAALSDTSRLAVETVPDGYLRTIFVRTSETAIEALTVSSDERGGTYLRITQAEAEVNLYRDEPLRLQALEGELAMSEGIIRYSAPRVELPDSRVSTAGVLDMSGEEPVYDIQVNGTDVALADVRWLYPAFPEEGEASFAMEIETRPDAVFVRASDLALQAPGTRLVGEFAVLLGDSVLFSDVSLTADPIDMETVEAMLPVAVPVRGLQIGSIEIETPAS